MLCTWFHTVVSVIDQFSDFANILHIWICGKINFEGRNGIIKIYVWSSSIIDAHSISSDKNFYFIGFRYPYFPTIANP